MSYPIITCPTGCSNDVPAINMDECNPQVDFSEVDKVYMTAGITPGCGLTDWTDASEWTSRIDNSGTDTCDIREWWVSGELPEPEMNITEIDNEREIQSPMKFGLECQVFDLDTDTYDAMRHLQCGMRVLIWYSAGNYLYGGSDGILATVVAVVPITKGSREANPGILRLKWEAAHNPERIDNPIAS